MTTKIDTSIIGLHTHTHTHNHAINIKKEEIRTSYNIN